MKKKLLVLMIFSCVIFNSFSQETKFNLFGSKEVFALSPVIDASIGGGFVLEYDTYRVDASLKTQLQKISKGIS